MSVRTHAEQELLVSSEEVEVVAVRPERGLSST